MSFIADIARFATLVLRSDDEYCGFWLACRAIRDLFCAAIGAILCSLMSSDPALAFQTKPETPPVLDAKSQKIEDLVTAAKTKMESRNWDAAMLDCTAALQVDEKSNRIRPAGTRHGLQR